MPASVSRAIVLPTALITPSASAPFSLPSRKGRQRVGRFAALADGDDDRAFLDDRIAIAELAGVGRLGDDLGEIFHQVIADEAPRATPVPGR
jgi:hypothetical protein